MNWQKLIKSIRHRAQFRQTSNCRQSIFKAEGSPAAKFFAVVDPFSEACLAHEVELSQQHGPQNWKRCAARSDHDLLFVESAWRGNQEQWRNYIVEYKSALPKTVRRMARWFKNHGKPTVFWNKEDPVHFERFLKNASAFDLIVTSDASCVPKYKEAAPNSKVFAMPFVAQPKMHNPLEEEPRSKSVCFAGTYYNHRYEERRADMEVLLDPARDFGLEILDRTLDRQEKEPQYRYPEKYQPHIIGSLPYDEMIKAYKRYKVFLNVNSVKDSDTMFARRVVELLASGTPVISTHGQAIEKLFGDIVLITESPEDTKKQLEMLLKDEEQWALRSTRGVRRVLGNFTYGHMLEKIGEYCSVQMPNSRIPVGVLASFSGAEELKRLCRTIANQTIPPAWVTTVGNCDAEFARAAFASEGITNIKHWESGPGAHPIYEQLASFTADQQGVVSFVRGNASYSDEYLKDAALAFSYWEGSAVGKHTFYEGDNLVHPDRENCHTTRVHAASLVIKTNCCDASTIQAALNQDWYEHGQSDSLLALHRYSFTPSSEGAEKALTI